MKKTLLIISVVVFAVFSANAQDLLWHFGFESDEISEIGVVPETEALYFDTISWEGADSLDLFRQDATMAHSGTGLCWLETTAIKNFWEQALKLRNCSFAEATSYRFTVYVKGTSTYINASNEEVANQIYIGPLQGVDYADAAVKVYNESSSTLTSDFGGNQEGFSPDTWEKIVIMFYYESNQQMQDWWDLNKPSWSGADDLEEKYFMLFNFYTPGVFMVDDLSLHNSLIGGIDFNGDQMVVDFGYDLDLTTLTLPYDFAAPADLFEIFADEVYIEPLTATLKSDGKVYITLSEAISSTAAVTVNYYNALGSAEELLYGSVLHPNSFDEGDTWQVKNFYDEIGTYNADLGSTAIRNTEVAGLDAYVYNDILYIKGVNNSNLNVEVISLTGAVVKQQTVTGNASISMKNLSKGIYLVKALDENNNIRVTKVTL